LIVSYVQKNTEAIKRTRQFCYTLWLWHTRQ